MKEEIIIAGFGGQGVLSMGKILAYSGLMEELDEIRHPAPLAQCWLTLNAQNLGVLISK